MKATRSAFVVNNCAHDAAGAKDGVAGLVLVLRGFAHPLRSLQRLPGALLNRAHGSL
jgi:hypothetical protein